MAANRVTPVPAAIVLVGGRSTRMGTDKASLVVDGVTMVNRVIAAATQAGVTTIITAGTDDLPDAVPSNSDAIDPVSGEYGPMAGIVGAWTELRRRRSHFDPVVVLACDLPWITGSVIADLLASAGARRHGATAHDGDRPQPLIAAYRPGALDEMAERYYEGERSVRRCFDDWELGEVRVDPRLVADADTPEDLAGFEVEWPM